MKVSGVKTADDLAKTLASLYKQRLESKQAKLAEERTADPMADRAKVKLLQFLVRELNEMEFV